MKKLLLLYLLCCCSWCAQAQKKDSIAAVDMFDIANKVLPPKLQVSKKKDKLTALLPFVGYNPSIGFRAGVSLSGGKYLGSANNTTLSIFSIAVSLSTKSTNILLFRHNAFTKKNKLNLQGDWQFSTNFISDYGLGSAPINIDNAGFIIDGLLVNNTKVSFPMYFNYFKLHERAYLKANKNFFVGAGIAVDVRWRINDERAGNNEITPHKEYSLQNNFSSTAYNAIGLVANFQWNTREHPNQSRSGVYADLIVRNNATWLGSSANALQINTDVRKYFPLSKTKKNLVLAFWHLGGYLVNGKLPYLEMPNTAFDLFNRSGRGYTFGRFRGPQYMYFESEIRFPISRNNLISGVAFVNTQTASVQQVEPLAKYWQYGVGTGLRVMLTKATRTNLCFDVAMGGKQVGIFFGLNEAF
jgi:hypothetical protein